MAKMIRSLVAVAAALFLSSTGSNRVSCAKHDAVRRNVNSANGIDTRSFQSAVSANQNPNPFELEHSVPLRRHPANFDRIPSSSSSSFSSSLSLFPRQRGGNKDNRRGKNKNNDPNGGESGNNPGSNVKGIGKGQQQQQFCQDNFPNLAAGDGTQNKRGFCSSTVQGAIPAVERMVSTIITSPNNGEQVDFTQDFDITLRTLNMVLGFFDDPQTRYYLRPQALDPQTGTIIGHQHVTVQRLPNKNPTDPLDPRQFEFFRGLDFLPSQPGNELSVTVPAGQIKGPGPARICSISGAEGHQPVVMPVAQRGSQDDCIRVDFVAGGGNKNNQNNNKNRKGGGGGGKNNKQGGR
ncbi:hypothetical protein HK102_006726, partial [Quaeritorhiza haematococci]